MSFMSKSKVQDNDFFLKLFYFIFKFNCICRDVIVKYEVSRRHRNSLK